MIMKRIIKQIASEKNLKIVSFNILAPQFSDNIGFPHTAPEYLSWENRKDWIVKEISNTKPNIICLQEFAQSISEDFLDEVRKDNENYEMMAKTIQADYIRDIEHKPEEALILRESAIQYFKIHGDVVGVRTCYLDAAKDAEAMGNSEKTREYLKLAEN